MNRFISSATLTVMGYSFALVLAGCAQMEYIKVPTPTQYDIWTDQDQRAADKMEGVRYYLPRPFLHLKQSTPVASRVALVSFSLKKGPGRQQDYYELDLPDDAPTWLRRATPKRISITQALATITVSAVEKQVPTSGDSGQEAAGEESESEGQAAGDSQQEGNSQQQETRPPTELTARTGFISDTDPVTRLGDRMDVVYLPDFDEQYVIRPNGGLGTVDVETRLRNGWAAEVFSQQVDNSNLIPYVIRQVEQASEAAAGIATTWLPVTMGLPPGTSPAKLVEMAGAGGGLEASGEVDLGEFDAEKILGNVLVFKIAEIRIAQPGVYPILKPREIRQVFRSSMLVSGRDPQETFELYLQQNNTPWIRPDMAFIPCPPFTVVGFNTTTDILMSHASKPIQLTNTTQSPPPNTTAITAAKQKIEQVLKAAPLINAGGVNLADKAAFDMAKLTFGIDGSGMRFTIPPVTGQTYANSGGTLTNEAEIEAWFGAALQLTSAQKGTVSASLNRTVLEIKVGATPTELAKNLP